MKSLIITMFTAIAIPVMAQDQDAKLDSLQRKVESLEKKVNVQQEQLQDLKWENKVLRKKLLKTTSLEEVLVRDRG